MVQRRKQRPRCEGCGLPPELCACELLPTIEVRTPIVVVQNVREKNKPTNTARLLQRMVPAIPILPYAMREPPFDPGPLLVEGVGFEVVYPREDSPVLSADAAPGRGFVLLDGTWHQCSRMTRRVPVVQDLPCVALPQGPPSIWSIRRQHDPRGLSTFEAGLRVLEIQEGPEVTAPLWEAFKIITARLLFAKGKLPTPDVPEAWR